ncbi:MAG: DegT/DnrJ/EryC1/StrS family aminotransferase [Deltaproteobacteria bacterium]|nr:DegT/DnrJ/EryC1/StrS family aminotransferase [Deltaproteobacteria bacterium]
MKVNLLLLTRQWRQIKNEALSEIKKVCSTQRLILGENVRALEEEIAGYCGVRHGIGVASGSDAIRLSLMALGVGKDALVATTPFTFFSTAGEIAALGARPVFVDIDPLTYNIDPERLESVLKKDRARRIKAVIPVHLYGQCADMSRIKAVTGDYGLRIIEDAAQSIGACYKGRMAGSMGDAGCISFYPTKNLGGFGDGGMVVTDSLRTADKIRMLRVHGSKIRYYHTEVGVNSRLDELQAAILRVKLKYLDGWAEKRRENARRYDRLLDEAGLSGNIVPPYIATTNVSVFNQYVVRAKKRGGLRAYLKAKGVSTEIYYPVPLHLQKCFGYLGCKRGDFPVSEKAARETLALPVYPELRKREIEYVVSAISDFYSGG